MIFFIALICAHLCTAKIIIESSTLPSLALDEIISNVAGTSGDAFGYSLDFDGATIVAGAFGASTETTQSGGAAFVYSQTAGVWEQEAMLSSPFSVTGDGFGAAVAVSGSFIAIGSPRSFSNNAQPGEVHIFQRNSEDSSDSNPLGPWQQQGVLSGQLPVLGATTTADLFGQSIDLVGTTLVVGSPKYSSSSTNFCGGVFIYRYQFAKWSLSQILVASDSSPGSFFGNSVSVSSDVLLIGSASKSSTTTIGVGSAYFFRQNSSLLWSQEQIMLPPTPVSGSLFGNSVSVHGNWGIIGAPKINNMQGAAYLYQFNLVSKIWELKTTLVPPRYTNNEKTNNPMNILFGSSVVIQSSSSSLSSSSFPLSSPSSSSPSPLSSPSAPSSPSPLSSSSSLDSLIIAVGATWDSTIEVEGGAVYLFRKDEFSKSLELTLSLYGQDQEARDNFGQSIALADDIVVIGSPHHRAGVYFSGSAFIGYVTCPSGFFGPNCLPCTCKFGRCVDGILGTGMCDTCLKGFYGINCDQNCTCGNYASSDISATVECRDGVSGDGRCVICSNGFWGPECLSTCTCVNGTCSEGLSGDGHCSECDPGFYGIDCQHECSCKYGSCEAGTSGSGKCECTKWGYGPSCEFCKCANGVCDSGVTGNGSCVVCEEGFYGKNCEFSCNCSDTCFEGIQGNGACSCPQDRILDNDGRTCKVIAAPDYSTVWAVTSEFALSQNALIVVVVGSVCAGLLFGTVVGVVVYFCTRKRK